MNLAITHRIRQGLRAAGRWNLDARLPGRAYQRGVSVIGLSVADG